MRKKLKIFPIIICVSAIISCNKENIDGFICEDFEMDESEYSLESPICFYDRPCCNPNDNDQFVYVKINSEEQSSSLVIYNLINKSEELIFSGHIFDQPQWGKSDWILFNNGDNNVWKIKPDGDSLTQLTFEDWSLYPRFNNDGDKIVFLRRMMYSDITMIMNLQGEIIDTIPEIKLGRGSWSSSNMIAYNPTGDKISYYDVNEDLIKAVYSPSKGSGSGICSWIPNSDLIVWLNYDFLNISNVKSNKTIELRKFCERRKYLWPSASANGDYILLQRTDKTLLPNNVIYMQLRIVKIDINGLNEEIILGI